MARKAKARKNDKPGRVGKPQTAQEQEAPFAWVKETGHVSAYMRNAIGGLQGTHADLVLMHIMTPEGERTGLPRLGRKAEAAMRRAEKLFTETFRQRRHAGIDSAVKEAVFEAKKAITEMLEEKSARARRKPKKRNERTRKSI